MAKNSETAKESVFKTIVSPVLVLLVICVVCGALLAALNQKTAPLIEENELLATQQAFLSVLPEGTDANSLMSLEVTTDGVQSAVKTADGKAAVKAVASGYSGKDVTVYHSGTAQADQGLVTAGGRVLGVTATADTLPEALKKAYAATEQIHFEGMHKRTDIGARALNALK